MLSLLVNGQFRRLNWLLLNLLLRFHHVVIPVEWGAQRLHLLWVNLIHSSQLVHFLSALIVTWVTLIDHFLACFHLKRMDIGICYAGPSWWENFNFFPFFIRQILRWQLKFLWKTLGGMLLQFPNLGWLSGLGLELKLTLVKHIPQCLHNLISFLSFPLDAKWTIK